MSFLQLQSAQYRNLQRSIDETRIARHDLRQHLTVLSGYAANKDLDAISDYRVLPETYDAGMAACLL